MDRSGTLSGRQPPDNVPEETGPWQQEGSHLRRGHHSGETPSVWRILPTTESPILEATTIPLNEAKSWPRSDFELFYAFIRVSFLFV